MKFESPIVGTRWHPLGCQCDACHPHGPADAENSSLGTVCLLVLAGMLAGVPIAAAIDALTTHVGILSVFGN